MNVKILLGVIAGLLVVIAIGVGVVIAQQSAADDQADYERCLSGYGFTAENVGQAALDGDDNLSAAVEACLD